MKDVFVDLPVSAGTQRVASQLSRADACRQRATRSEEPTYTGLLNYYESRRAFSL